MENKAITISGSLGGGKQKKQHVPVESPNTLRSKAIYRSVEVLCEGPIEGFAFPEIGGDSTGAGGFRSVFINDTPLTSISYSNDITWNFSGVGIELKEGTVGQSAMGNVGDAVTTPLIGQSLPVALTKPAISAHPSHTVTLSSHSTTDHVLVTIEVTQLYSVSGNGDSNPSEVSFSIKVGSAAAATYTIKGKCMSPYYETYRIARDVTDTDWTVTVTKITDDFKFGKDGNNAIQFASLMEVTSHKMQYPDTAYVGVTVDASQFGSDVPKRSVRIKGLKVRCPSGYNTSAPGTPVKYVPPSQSVGTWDQDVYTPGEWVAGSYPDVWDGSWTEPLYTSNPVWCFNDFATNNRYGTGLPEIPKNVLLPLAKYCDELVKSGFTKTVGNEVVDIMEPRFTLNCCINTQAEAYQVLNTLVSVFRGMIWWGAGNISISQDSPSEPVVNATISNVIDGVFNYEGTALKARHTVVMVTWNNPANHYLPEIEYVADQQGIITYGYKVLDLAPMGCTSRGLARRLGKWALYSETYEGEIVSYTAGLDHAYVVPGMIVNVQDPFRSSIRLSGRVHSESTTTSIYLDDNVDFGKVANSLSICCTLPTHTNSENETPKVEVRAIISHAVINGKTVVHLNSAVGNGVNCALSMAPEKGSVWLIAATGVGNTVVPRTFRVISNTESDGKYSIVALEHHAEKFSYVEQGTPFTKESYSIPQIVGPLTPPGGVKVIKTAYSSTDGSKYSLLVSWSPSIDSRVVKYKVQYKLASDNSWITLYTDNGVSVELKVVSLGNYDFQICSMNSSGGQSKWVSCTYTLEDSSMPVVTGLKLVNQYGYDDVNHKYLFGGGDAQFIWDAVSTSEDVLGVPTLLYFAVEVWFDDVAVLWSKTTTNSFFFSFAKNKSLLGVAQRQFIVKVYQVGVNGSFSSIPAVITCYNPAPTLLGQGLTVESGFRSLALNWQLAGDTDVLGYKVHCDATDIPTTLVATTLPESHSYNVQNLENLVEYHAQVTPFDIFGEGDPSNTVVGTPLILTGVDVNIELRDSVYITDSEAHGSTWVAPLYDRIRSDGPTVTYDTTLGTQWIQYYFNIENYIDKVIIYGLAAGYKFYVSTSVKGDETDDRWFGGVNTDNHDLNSYGELVQYNTQQAAAAAWWAPSTAISQAILPQQVTSKYCRLYIVSGQSSVILTEVMFVREVIAEQVVADNLSAISAKLGIVYSDTYVAGVSGFMLDGPANMAEFNNMIVNFSSNPSDDNTWDKSILNGPPGDAINTTNLVRRGYFDDFTDVGRWSGGEVVPTVGKVWVKSLKVTQENIYELPGMFCTPSEWLYVSAWVSTSGCAHHLGVGACFFDAAGIALKWVVGASLGEGTSWEQVLGRIQVPADAVAWTPWIHVFGTTDLNAGYTVAQISMYRHESGATVGAPVGTLVGGTLAETVVATGEASAQTLSDIANDGKFTIQEKATWRKNWVGIKSVYESLYGPGKPVTLLHDYGTVASTSITCTSKYNTLESFLTNYPHSIFATTPTVSEFSVHSAGPPIVYDFEFAYTEYQNALQALSNALSSAAKEQGQEYVDGITSKIQADGEVVVWYTKTAENPSVAWTTTELKTAHVGDVWFQLDTLNTSNILSNVVVEYLDTFVWSAPITNEGRIKSFLSGAVSKDTADGKRRVFTVATAQAGSQFEPLQYDVGDLWADGTVIKRCINSKNVGDPYSAAHWVDAATIGANWGDTGNPGNIIGKPDNDLILNSSQTWSGSLVTDFLLHDEGTSLTTVKNWGAAADTTKIDGGKIYTGSVTTTQLNFSPVTTSNVTATVTSILGGLQIDASKLTINASTTFGTGYNPASKVAIGEAASDINAGTTNINGGRIVTEEIVGKLKSTNGLNYVNLSATGTEKFLRVGPTADKDCVYFTADGLGYVSRDLITPAIIVGKGEIGANDYTDRFAAGGTYYIHTGVNDGTGWGDIGTGQKSYAANVTVSGAYTPSAHGVDYRAVWPIQVEVVRMGYVASGSKTHSDTVYGVGTWVLNDNWMGVSATENPTWMIYGAGSVNSSEREIAGGDIILKVTILERFVTGAISSGSQDWKISALTWALVKV